MSARSGLVGKKSSWPHFISFQGNFSIGCINAKQNWDFCKLSWWGCRFSYIDWHFFGCHQDVNDLEKDNCISEGPQHGIDAAKVSNVALKVSMATDGNGLLGWLTKRLPGSAGSNWTSEPLQTSIFYFSGPWKTTWNVMKQRKTFSTNPDLSLRKRLQNPTSTQLPLFFHPI